MGTIGRSRDSAPACPRDLVDYPMVLSSLSPLVPWISAMAASSFTSSCLAFPSTRSGAGGCGALPTCHRRLPVAWCHRGRVGTASPCHGGTSGAMSKFPSTSTLLCNPLELAVAMVLLPDELGFLPHAWPHAIKLGFAMMCEIHAL
jgi:hypothetical protein